MKVLKILIVDDHPVVGDGYRALLEQPPLSATVLVVSCGVEALECLTRNADIQIILLDIHLRDTDSFSTLRTIKGLFPEKPCVMISGDSQPERAAYKAHETGADGFIPKSYGPDQLIAAIQDVLAGSDGFEEFRPEFAALDVIEKQRQTAEPPAPVLTQRQHQVMRLLGEGRSNKEIARMLRVAERTIKAHVSAIFDLLNVKNRTQAVLVARKIGLLRPDSDDPAAA